MQKKSILLLITGIFFFLIVILYLLDTRGPDDSSVPNDIPTPGGSFPDLTNSRLPQTIKSISGTAYSVTPYLESTDTTLMTENFYQNSSDTDQYDIFYDENKGNIMILLYDENLAFTRSLAERQLTNILPYTPEEFCDMEILVQTNEYVSPQYSGINLGLSFCPGSVPL